MATAKLDAPLTFHDLRQMFASRWMMRGGSLLTLSKVPERPRGSA